MGKSFPIIVTLLLVLSMVLGACGQAITTAPISTPALAQTTAQTPSITQTPTPTLTTSSTLTSPKPAIITIDDIDPSFKWTGRWEAKKQLGAWSDTLTVCPPTGQPPAPGSKVEITFTGSQISLIYATASYGGILDVQIDGKAYAEIDMYSKEVKYLVKTLIAKDLPNTQHTLIFTVSGRVNPSLSGDPKFQSGGLVNIDAIEVIVPPEAK